MRYQERAEPAVRAHRSFGGSRGQTGGDASGVLTLTDGTVVPIRTVSPRDALALKRLHGRLSERSIELRFFGPLKELSDEMAVYLARAADADHLALAALEPDGHGEIIAVVRYAREAGTERAEYAAVVEDSWQGSGLGRAMTNRLIQVARERGIRRLYALVAPENARMLGLLRDLGLPTRMSRDGDAKCVEIDLLQGGLPRNPRGPGGLGRVQKTGPMV
jgi:GNAT superfamily N-acetyltransferase